MGENANTYKLNYTIHSHSSHSAKYVPENILVNKPKDHLSRWFTDSNTASQYITLKLDAPAIVETVTFGKYIKPHVSDLKKFQVYGGMEEANMSEVLSAGLKNDNTLEKFPLRHRTSEGLYFPVQYVKIVPLQSWGPAYNYTIWFVELHGCDEEELVSKAIETINLRIEDEAVRIVLKHLRRRRYTAAFEALSRESGVRLEGGAQARLWTALVEHGDYEKAERIFLEAVEDGELGWYTSWQPYRPRWRQLSACSARVRSQLSRGATAPPAAAAPTEELPCDDREPRPNAEEVSPEDVTDADPPFNKPGPRGGHQLVVDSTTGTLYLFGGWSGTEDLDDLWSYSIEQDAWTLLCRHCGESGGPSPRSCHKMVFDPVHRRLYTLGRYLNSAQRVPENMKSDLHAYDVPAAAWQLVCADTAAARGPRLVFDHQMCLDHATQTCYVFGGRVLPCTTDEAATPQYSGLYAYYIATDTWQLLIGDDEDTIPARVGHSMLFHPTHRRLYIFAGQRNKSHLLELWQYDVDAGAARALCRAEPRAPPAAGFTQRATLDPHTDDIFVLEGMSKEKDKRVYNTLWVFSLRRLAWSCVYRSECERDAEPRPRFAHQLVYDPVRKIHYLFGGNPGAQHNARLRLDDLWALSLRRAPPPARAAAAALRERRYRELCARAAPAALRYLRADVRTTLDAHDPAEVARFQQLPRYLFSPPPPAAAPRGLTPAAARRLTRARARAAPPQPSAAALAVVLGAEDSLPSPTQPFEAIAETAPDTWDVGDPADEPDDPAVDWEARAGRVALYDQLCRYFRPSTVPPRADVTHLVKL